MTKKHKVLILGFGEMGHAVQQLLKGHHELFIWDKFPTVGFRSVVLEDAAPQADIVFFCLPVNPHRGIAEHIAPLLKKDCICLSIAKGLDEAGQTAAQIFSDVFSTTQPYALLYGPMIAEEIRSDRYAFAQLGCTDVNVYQKTAGLFSGSKLYLKHSTDISGICWSVILKNVYALSFGMADELNLGDNMRGHLATAALQELDQIVQKMGGQAGTPFQLAGLGDLITTATSETSHHHELGRMLAREETENIKGEGVHTLKMVNRYQLINKDDYPLFQLIDEIVQNPKGSHQKIDRYLMHFYS